MDRSPLAHDEGIIAYCVNVLLINNATLVGKANYGLVKFAKSVTDDGTKRGKRQTTHSSGRTFFF